MEEAITQEKLETAQSTQPAPQETVPSTAQDPFALDENAFASLSPEQRASLDPILESWKKRASDEITRRESESAKKYKPYEEKASALDKLTQYQPFVQWWQAQQKQAYATATPAQASAIEQTKPQDIATQQEWQEAIWEASQGNPDKLQNLQSRMMNAWATPFVQNITQKQQALETQLELKDLFERHPDAKDLDAIGLDPNTKEGVSLLEIALDWAERNGKTLEDGYNMGKRWADSLKVGAQQQAMGLVNEKKAAVTAGPSTAKPGQTVVEVENADELIRRSLEAQMTGNKDTRFVIKGK